MPGILPITSLSLSLSLICLTSAFSFFVILHLRGFNLLQTFHINNYIYKMFILYIIKWTIKSYNSLYYKMFLSRLDLAQIKIICFHDECVETSFNWTGSKGFKRNHIFNSKEILIIFQYLQWELPITSIFVTSNDAFMTKGYV